MLKPMSRDENPPRSEIKFVHAEHKIEIYVVCVSSLYRLRIVSVSCLYRLKHPRYCGPFHPSAGEFRESEVDFACARDWQLLTWRQAP